MPPEKNNDTSALGSPSHIFSLPVAHRRNAQARSQLLGAYTSRIILPQMLQASRRHRVNWLSSLSRRGNSRHAPELLCKLGLTVLEAETLHGSADDPRDAIRDRCLQFFQYLLHRKPRTDAHRTPMTELLLLEYASFAAAAGATQLEDAYLRVAEAATTNVRHSVRPVFALYASMLAYGMWHQQLLTRDPEGAFTGENLFDADTGVFIGTQALPERLLFYPNSYFPRAKQHFVTCRVGICEGPVIDSLMPAYVNLLLMEGDLTTAMAELNEVCTAHNLLAPLSQRLLLKLLTMHEMQSMSITQVHAALSMTTESVDRDAIYSLVSQTIILPGSGETRSNDDANLIDESLTMAFRLLCRILDTATLNSDVETAWRLMCQCIRNASFRSESNTAMLAELGERWSWWRKIHFRTTGSNTTSCYRAIVCSFIDCAEAKLVATRIASQLHPQQLSDTMGSLGFSLAECDSLLQRLQPQDLYV